MKKHMLCKVNLLISAIIAIAFCTVLLINYNTHKTLLRDDIEHIAKLASSTIYAGINDELTKPLYVSQTMANDTFLKTWIKEEKALQDDRAHMIKIERYLRALREKYGYETAYTISAQTGTYYYYNGVNKIVGQNDKHDKWYFNFIKSGEKYVLNIDEDEVHNGELTVFIDSRIEDSDGNLIGVTGVGIRLSELQQLLHNFEQDYELEAYLIRDNGNVSIHTDPSRIGQSNVYDEHTDKSLHKRVAQSRDGLQMHWMDDGDLSNCVISRYIENLDWYLIVEKDTRALYRSFQNMLSQDLIVSMIVLAMLLLISTFVIRTYQRIIYENSQLDQLTGLYNRQYLKEAFRKHGKKWLAGGATFFLFDIDHFKQINDTLGHLTGNQVLEAVGNLIGEEINGHGIAVRWGGDEFAGLLTMPQDEALTILEGIRKRVSALDFGSETMVSISVGVTEAYPGDTPDILLEQADQALYDSKDQGRNRISVYTKR